ncbi:protein-methionine-sulfoxide reductase catalytic subunit MsrP [Nordella sp. HKS 07]|uniref:protein-methionine-sulfoxide reductase catalytic subunit MsrP n=1 Tax=Nordella sp. HKS 07 TaxID=2712222 RepID=UPI0013E15943|nr:protein-methionine-sulfoxide reductase catalytic subunit MsrP [Nordella sp. HKS 07]QIG46409.1 protein-methionine-sulfoxide reductase catalytic subunit MsrP [Nordella sp. HKS 07]
MLIKRKIGWELPERLVTPEPIFLNRRALLAGLAGAAMAGFTDNALADSDPSQGLYPAPRNPAFKDAGRAVTDEKYNTNYNNFYEFGTSKTIASEAENLRIRPWEIAVDGEVEKPFTIGIDDLLKKMTLEERIYRHRCVEAWSMVVPWSGFPMRKLVEIAKPKADAKYVRFETFNDPEMASGQQPGLFGSMPWPYVEGLTMAEAMHDLTFVVTGAYGKPVAKSMGAPIRIHMPWKYGFKSIKSIVKVSFVTERPIGLWEQLQASEYGFWANVNPDVPHPRWSQASEQVLGTGERVPTQLFNGYGEFVAALYTGLENEKLYM